MDWDEAPVESGVPGFGSSFLTFDLPEDWEVDEGDGNGDDDDNGGDNGGGNEGDSATQARFRLTYSKKRGWHFVDREHSAESGGSKGSYGGMPAGYAGPR